MQIRRQPGEQDQVRPGGEQGHTAQAGRGQQPPEQGSGQESGEQEEAAETETEEWESEAETQTLEGGEKTIKAGGEAETEATHFTGEEIRAAVEIETKERVSHVWFLEFEKTEKFVHEEHPDAAAPVPTETRGHVQLAAV